MSGSALLVDYVLTIAISLASCSESIFSLFPPGLQAVRIPFTFILLGALTLLNLRGARESVTVISPIFIAFVVSHVGAIVAAVVLNIHQVPIEVDHLREQSALAVRATGWIPLLMILFRASRWGRHVHRDRGGEQRRPMLREPKVETAKITMRYMAFSLALIAGGILFGYLLYSVHPIPGKTLNAVLWYAVAGQLFPPGSHLGSALVAILLLSAGALLFVAAQTGFLGGPRVLVYMALDRWVPSRFANLSERLVSSNGVMFMAIAAAAVLAITGSAVHILVVLYSINVFLTFSLAQLG